MYKFILTIIAATTLLSCKAKTAVSAPVNVNAPIASNKFFYDEILKKATFDQVKINSKVDVQNGSFIPTLDATIYIENNHKVWMNMSALFLNVARGIATNTGIKGYEKYNKTYIDSDFAYLNRLLNVNFIDLNSLQNLLLGRTFIPINEKDFELTKNAQGYTLNSINNYKIIADGISSEYKIELNYTPEFDLTSVNLLNMKSAENLQVFYSNWTSLENLRVPQNVKIIIKNNKESQILIENTKFDLSKMETPYSVPSNYTKTVIK